MTLSIPKSELKQRQEKLRKNLSEQDIDGAILFSNINIFYLTGFYFWTTERPIALIVNADSTMHLLVPRLELEHAEAFAFVDKVISYPEYPGIKHPMLYLKELLNVQQKTERHMGFDSNGYGSPSGYHGPSLTAELFPTIIWKSIRKTLEEMRYINLKRKSN